MKKKILIVDDEEDITWSISRGLIKDKRTVELLCVNNGSAALDILLNNKIDLLITDIRMPGVNGRQLLDQVKQQFPEVKIILMTAYGSRDIDEMIRGATVSGYIEKPFDIAELRKLIMSILNKNELN